MPRKKFGLIAKNPKQNKIDSLKGNFWHFQVLYLK